MGSPCPGVDANANYFHGHPVQVPVDGCVLKPVLTFGINNRNSSNATIAIFISGRPPGSGDTQTGTLWSATPFTFPPGQTTDSIPLTRAPLQAGLWYVDVWAVAYIGNVDLTWSWVNSDLFKA